MTVRFIFASRWFMEPIKPMIEEAIDLEYATSGRTLEPRVLIKGSGLTMWSPIALQGQKGAEAAKVLVESFAMAKEALIRLGEEMNKAFVVDMEKAARELKIAAEAMKRNKIEKKKLKAEAQKDKTHPWMGEQWRKKGKYNRGIT